MMHKRKGKIDGFWLLLIAVFVILPIVQSLTKQNVKETDGKIVFLKQMEKIV